MNFLCDTNIISEIMKRSPEQRVEAWLSEQDIIFLSVISIDEIYYGLAYKDARQQLTWFKQFLEFRVKVLPITQAIAKQSGLWRGQFRQNGITRSQSDLLIAATADNYHLTLATRNIRDFTDCNIQLFNPFNPS